MNTGLSLHRSRGWRVLLVTVASLATLLPGWGSAGSLPTQAAADSGNVRLGVMRLAPGSGYSSLADKQAESPSLLSTAVFTDVTPVTPVKPPPQGYPVPGSPGASEGNFRYFTQTAHFLRGPFLSYWETHGATAVLGLPITEALLENGLTVQYLERVRLEWHPEISTNPKQQVLLTRLGAVMSEANGQVFESLPSGNNTSTSHFFTETGHNLANGFFDYWLRNGGLAVFGYPISEELVETNAADSKQYTVQYFERNRFEFHPEKQPPYNIQLGLLGVEYARMIGLNPLARTLLPGPYTGSDQDMSDSPELKLWVDPELVPVVQALGRTPQYRWIPRLIIQNRITVEFQAVNEEGVAGAFVSTRNKNQPYLLIIPDTEKGEQIETLGSVIAHESTHAYDVVTGALPKTSGCSVEAEVRAFMNGLTAWIVLKGQDALATTYPAQSFEFALNRSLKGFNSGKTNVEFDFNVAGGRAFLRNVYGASCGK